MVAPFLVAVGDAPSVSLPAAATVNIAPPDDSVDSNRVIITCSGTISSFGVAVGALTRFQYDPDPEDVACTDDIITVTKSVEFIPDAGQTITLKHNPPYLNLLGGVDRVIKSHSFGEYQSDTQGWWWETAFSQSTVSPVVGPGGLLDLISYTASQTITIPATASLNATVTDDGLPRGSTVAGVLVGSAGTGAGGYLEVCCAHRHADLHAWCGRRSAFGRCGRQRQRINSCQRHADNRYADCERIKRFCICGGKRLRHLRRRLNRYTRRDGEWW